jgi:hypothetical protein
MKKILLGLTFFVFALNSQAQEKYFTKTGKINFKATAPSSPEKIEGLNKSVTCVIDSKSGAIQFSALMKGFEFERALMQEHFNENYVESSKFPKAEFKGQISNNADVNYTKDGNYAVKVLGKLTMHGEKKDVTADGKVIIKNGKVSVASSFVVLLADYKVVVPSLVADKVSKNATIVVDCNLEVFKK